MSENKRPSEPTNARAESPAAADRSGAEPTVPLSKDEQMRAAVHGPASQPAAQNPGTANQQRRVDAPNTDGEPTTTLSQADRERIGAQDTAETPRVEDGTIAGINDRHANESEVEQTRPLDVADVQAEERDREAEREARQRALGVRPRSDEVDAPVVAARQVRTTDRWHGALAFTILRWIVAGVIGIRSYQHFTHLTAAQDYYSTSRLPHFAYYGWGVAIVEALIAVFLFLGLATRFAGLLLAALEILTLIFFVWGKVNPFMDGRMGFNGELELLLAGLGLVFVLLGSGGWAFDAGFRRRRRKAKEAKAMGNPV